MIIEGYLGDPKYIDITTGKPDKNGNPTYTLHFQITSKFKNEALGQGTGKDAPDGYKVYKVVVGGLANAAAIRNRMLHNMLIRVDIGDNVPVKLPDTEKQSDRWRVMAYGYSAISAVLSLSSDRNDQQTLQEQVALAAQGDQARQSFQQGGGGGFQQQAAPQQTFQPQQPMAPQMGGAPMQPQVDPATQMAPQPQFQQPQPQMAQAQAPMPQPQMAPQGDGQAAFQQPQQQPMAPMGGAIPQPGVMPQQPQQAMAPQQPQQPFQQPQSQLMPMEVNTHPFMPQQ